MFCFCRFTVGRHDFSGCADVDDFTARRRVTSLVVHNEVRIKKLDDFSFWGKRNFIWHGNLSLIVICNKVHIGVSRSSNLIIWCIYFNVLVSYREIRSRINIIWNAYCLIMILFVVKLYMYCKICDCFNNKIGEIRAMKFTCLSDYFCDFFESAICAYLKDGVEKHLGKDRFLAIILGEKFAHALRFEIWKFRFPGHPFPKSGHTARFKTSHCDHQMKKAFFFIF